MSRYKTYLLGVISLLAGAAVFAFVDFHDVMAALGQTSASTLLVSSLLLVVTHVLSYFRFGVVLRSFGFRPGWRTLFMAFSIGQISNHFLLNILGQSLSRAMVLARGGVPFGAAIAATLFERLLAAGLLFVFSLAALAYLLNEIAFDFQRGGAYLAWMIGSMLVVGLVVCVVVLRDDLRTIQTKWAGRSLLPILLTVLSHAAMLAAYAVILVEAQPQRMTLAVVAALTIVMFTSSLPISFSGWGVRELSAATALSLVGVPSSLAVAAAFSVGILTILVMAIFAVLSFVMIRKAPKIAVEAKDSKPTSANKWDAVLVRICGLFCAVFIYFQIRVPVASHNLTVNVADLAAVTGGALVLLLIVTKRLRLPLPRYASLSLAGLSLVIGGGLVVAYFHNILGNWALVNRGVGWLILLSYVAVPAALVAMWGEEGRTMLIRAAVTAALAVCAVQLAAMLAVFAGVRPPTDVFSLPLEGFVDNQNAFSLQLAMIAVLLAAGMLNETFRHTTSLVLAFVVIALTVYYSKSRTGLILMGIIAAWMYGVSYVRTMQGMRAAHNLRVGAVAIGATFLGALVLPYVIAYGWAVLTGDSGETLLGSLMRMEVLGIRIAHAASETERWMTITDGWKLFLAHPVLGSGLGGYMEQRLAAGIRGDVIHSTPVWFLAETGLAGLAVVTAVTWAILRNTWRLQTVPATAAYAWGLLAVMSVMIIGGLAHDYFYQRIFWFLFGVLIIPLAEGAKGENARQG